MRAFLLGSVVSIALTPASVSAFDHSEFCASMLDQADKQQLEAGVWLDEFTRNDSVHVYCSMRMIEFRRALDLPSGELDDGWRQREKARWNAAHCNDPDWRTAILNGWTIASTLTTTTGERIWYTANCR